MSEHILIVDDEAGIRSTLAGILGDEGYRATGAASAAEAASSLARDAFDLVLLDVWLPDRDGLELLSELRRSNPDLPVIAYLLEHNAESRGRAERSGLSMVWRGPDAGNPDPAAVRLIYADRPVPGELLARVAAHP